MLVLWLVGAHLCANQPPYSNIFIKCAEEHHEQYRDGLLGKVEQNLMQLKIGSQTTHAPKTSTSTTHHGGLRPHLSFPS